MLIVCVRGSIYKVAPSPNASSSVMLTVLEGEWGLAVPASSPLPPRGAASSMTITDSSAQPEAAGPVDCVSKEEEEGESESGLPSGNGESVCV